MNGYAVFKVQTRSSIKDKQVKEKSRHLFAHLSAKSVV